MRIFLSGVETENKGAELMLYAILQQIEKHDPSSVVYIEENRFLQDISYINTNLKIVKLKNLGKRLIRRFRINGILRLFSIKYEFQSHVKIPKIDYYFDGCGLLFSDSNELKGHIKYYTNILEQLTKYKSISIFLPQAFGPVDKEDTKESIKMLSKYSDIIYARENISYNYVKSVSGIDLNKVRVCTDFSALVEGNIPQNYDYLKNGVCIIPNFNMITRNLISISDYAFFIKSIINYCSKIEKRVYFLNHEGERDEKLIYDIVDKLAIEVPIVAGLNALETKGLISTAYLVISSRYHGVASSLNSCVPCLATSWNHKYECLYMDYGIDEGVLDLKRSNDPIDVVIRYLDPELNRELRTRLMEKKSIITSNVEQMWEEIWMYKK